MSVFHHFLKIFLVLSPFLLDPDKYCFCLDPDPYQNLPWIRIRNEFFHILDLDPDSYKNDTDPPHCLEELSLQMILAFLVIFPHLPGRVVIADGLAFSPNR